METVFRRVFDNELIDTFPFEDSTNIMYLDFLFYDTVESSIKKEHRIIVISFSFSPIINYK